MTAPVPRPEPPLRLRLADLGAGRVARLVGTTLYLDPAADRDSQLAALADAVEYLRTGRARWGRQVRHLSLVRTEG